MIGDAHFRLTPLTDVDADELVGAGKAGRLVAAGLMEEAEVALLEFGPLAEFWQSEVGRAIAGKALARKTGARGLRSILEHVLLDVMYDLPSHSNLASVIVDEATITKQVTILKTAGVDLIAEAIGSYDELGKARNQGFTHFQGSFLSPQKPSRRLRHPKDNWPPSN